jgi:exopolysaccharide production protein ExoZ
MIKNLQALRAFAALSVVYLHAAITTPFAVGNFGVDVFFVISGFIMSHVCATDPSRFIARRLARIVPLYWLATLALFALAVVAPAIGKQTNAELPHLIQSLLFIPYLKSPGQIMPILDPGWTLNYEMAFYAIVAIALWLGLRRYATAVAAVSVALGVLVLNACAPSSATALFYTNWIAVEFSLGVAVYWLSNVAAGKASTPALLVVLVAALGAMVLAEMRGAAAGSTVGRLVWMGAPSAAFVLAAILLERVYAVTNRLVLLLGDASYAIYLTHFFVIETLRKIVLPRAGVVDTNVIAIAVAVVISAVVGVAVHLFVEKPVLNLLMRRRKSALPTQTVSPA